MNNRILLSSIVLFFVLALSSCGVYEKCPGEGSVEEKSETNA